MRDVSLQRFLRCLASPAKESAARGADGAAIRSSLGRRGRCETANRSFWRGSLSAVVLMFRGVLALLGEILAGLASSVRPSVVSARFNRFVQRRLPQAPADCCLRATLAVTDEV